MLTYPNINPIAFHLGPLPVYWYGLMYLVGFAACYGFLAVRIKTSDRGFTMEQLSDILFYAALGVIIGGRLGYVLFYDRVDIIHHPLHIFETWKGGMSFHGGLLGVIIAVWIYGRKIGKSFIQVTDFIAPGVPLGLLTGRIGNFINSELWGRATDMPWGMIPPGGNFPHHPSQLYEALLEGLVMFIILWWYSRKPKPRWAVSGLFLVLYGCFRTFVEFFREPDPQVGYLAFGWFTEGQLLSIPMIIIGIIMMAYAYKRRQQ